jgi:hypothetical protein
MAYDPHSQGRSLLTGNMGYSRRKASMLRSVNRFEGIFQSNRPLKALAGLAVFVGLVWFATSFVLSGNVKSQEIDLVLVAAVTAGLSVLASWRTGIYLFIVWIVFEDLARKFLGNNMFIYFGKDALVAVICAVYLYEVGRRREKTWRPPFWPPLLVFFWWAAMEAFNPKTPSAIYGLLGLKLYFCYVPLLFIGYALVRKELDLRRFLIINLAIAGLVSFLGIAQAIFGQQLLNPQTLDESLRDLGDLNRTSPVSGLVFNRPTSVFVSDGRFGAYLLLMYVLGFGAIGYFIQRRWENRKTVYLCFGLVCGAILLSGVRTALGLAVISTAVMVPAMFWGQKFRRGQVLQILKAIRRMALFGATAALCLALFYPSALASRWAFYTETLSPTGRASELELRTWTYPISELVHTFRLPDWQWGRGLGTVSLGVQYVTRFLHAPQPAPGVESGYGGMLLEMGIPGLILWIVLSVAVVWACWGEVRKLRSTPMFSLAFSIFWFALIVLFPLSFVSLATYQDFIINAYLWLLIGVLFRLPTLTNFPLPRAG